MLILRTLQLTTYLHTIFNVHFPYESNVHVYDYISPLTSYGME